jgi:succinoglycan biosynthesis protein ExoA
MQTDHKEHGNRTETIQGGQMLAHGKVVAAAPDFSRHRFAFISVIVPCRNERRFIGLCLDSILASDYPADSMEVIVADGMSDDGTRELIAAYAARDRRVRRIDNPAGVTPVALNLAIEAAGGDVIARVDAHASIAPDYFSRCARLLDSSGADNVGGTMRTLAAGTGPFSEPIAIALSHRFGVGNSYFRIGSRAPRWVDTVFGGFYRRQVFDRVGLFNERLIRTQDLEFNLRLKAAGGKTLLAPEVRCDYHAQPDLPSFWKHNVLNGEWAVLPFLYSAVIPVRVRHLIPLLFVSALIAGIAALPWTRVALAAVIVAYLLANAAASIHAAWRARGTAFLWRMPIVFASLHVGYGLGGVQGVFKMFKRLLKETS